MIASRVLLRSPLATVARRAVAVSSVRATAVRSYSSQAAPSGGAGKSLVIAALAAGAGAAGYHYYAESQSKSSYLLLFFFAYGYTGAIVHRLLLLGMRPLLPPRTPNNHGLWTTAQTFYFFYVHFLFCPIASRSFGFSGR
jgi:hypothetical protein